MFQKPEVWHCVLRSNDSNEPENEALLRVTSQSCTSQQGISDQRVMSRPLRLSLTVRRGRQHQLILCFSQQYFTSLNTLFLLLLLEMWMHCNINWCFLRLSSSYITLGVHLAGLTGLIKPVCLHGWRRQNYKAKVMRLCSPNSCFTAAGGIETIFIQPST